jgi:Cu(I)/Ag(I) efflux system membrane protein CusA/SilA
MKRIAAPMVGGILTSFLLELLVYPAVYAVWRGRQIPSQVSARQELVSTGYLGLTGEADTVGASPVGRR